MHSATDKYISQKKQFLNSMEKSLQYLDPQNTLKRGFSITRHNNIAVKDSNELKEGDAIETIYFKGKSVSTIKKIKNA